MSAQRGYMTEQAIEKIIRESALCWEGRSFLFLIFLEKNRELKGFLQTPLSGDHDVKLFENEHKLENLIYNFIQDTYLSDKKEIIQKTYIRWLRSGISRHADWAVHLRERKEDGDWEGRMFDVKGDRETVFYSRETMFKIMRAAKQRE